MSEDEAIVLHVTIAVAEFETGLNEVDLQESVAQKVLSDLQQALAPLIPGLGTEIYQAHVDRAFGAIDPEPF